MTEDAPLFVLLNTGSGNATPAERRAVIGRVFDEAGRRHEITVVDAPGRLPALARAVVARARAQGGAVVAAGGDGTINAVVQAVLGSGCPMGVLPQGTFNYFGRAHGIPTDLEAAARALLSARTRAVQVGLVNERVFLVNASLGLYPALLEDREAWKQRLGRSRPVALAAAAATVLRDHRPLRLTIDVHGESRQVRTSTVFVGNNPLQLERLGLPFAGSVGAGLLGLIVVRPIGALGLLWLALRGALGDLADADAIVPYGVERLVVRPSRLYRARRVKVATDGEVVWLDVPLRFSVSPEPLMLLVPAAPGASEGRDAGAAACPDVAAGRDAGPGGAGLAASTTAWSQPGGARA
jgi:diacylglycerol kinase family enzyme